MTFRHILRYVTLMKDLNNLDGSVEVPTNVQHVMCKIKLARQYTDQQYTDQQYTERQYTERQYTDHKEVQKKAK